MSIRVNLVVDAKGLSCPMPIVKTKKGLEQITSGQVLEVQATDRGSIADIQGFAKSTGHYYLGTKEEEGHLKHYIRKASPEETKEEIKFSQTVNNEELIEKLTKDEQPVILDVREPAEFAFNHIPGAVSIPYGELESRLNELQPTDEIFVICRTGNRSDQACQLMFEQGFKQVKNVIPGMSEWTGPVTTA